MEIVELSESEDEYTDEYSDDEKFEENSDDEFEVRSNFN